METRSMGADGSQAAPRDDEPGVFADASLVAFAPTRWIQVAGSAALLVATGIAGGVWGLVVFGSGQVSVFTITFSRPPTSDRGSTIARLRRRLRPWFMGEAAVMLAAAVALGVVSVFAPLPRHLAADYETNAIVLLFFAAGGAVWLVVRRRRQTDRERRR